MQTTIWEVEVFFDYQGLGSSIKYHFDTKANVEESIRITYRGYAENSKPKRENTEENLILLTHRVTGKPDLIAKEIKFDLLTKSTHF